MRRMHFPGSGLGLVFVMLATSIPWHVLHADIVSDILNLTGGKHVRAVWTRQEAEAFGGDALQGYDTTSVLMGLCTREGRERVICSRLSSYRHPVVCPRGDRVVFTTGSLKVGE